MLVRTPGGKTHHLVCSQKHILWEIVIAIKGRSKRFLILQHHVKIKGLAKRICLKHDLYIFIISSILIILIKSNGN